MVDKQQVNVGGNVTGDVIVAGGDVNIDRRTIFSGEVSKEDRIALRDRKLLLDKVQRFWVEGVLEKSLHGAALIELGIQEVPNAVNHPMKMVLDTLKESGVYETIPQNKPIIDVFVDAGNSLLILGDPGSGKTTILLELARSAVRLARNDIAQPIPVVFNLSSWSIGLPVAEWIIEELALKYGVPSRVGEELIANQEMLLLLDGLDEVRQTQRQACIDAINLFRVDHGLTPLAVCSRTGDYKALGKQLRMEGAVVIQPLTKEQVNEYLKRAGDDLLAVRTLLHTDEPLQEMVESPLILSIMTLAYNGLTVSELDAFDTVDARRKHLFDTYIKRMFKRRVGVKPYKQEDVVRWLSWLAARMDDENQTIFQLEGIQSRWLEQGRQRLWYEILHRVASGLLLGIVSVVIMLVLAIIIQAAEYPLLRNYAPILIQAYGSLSDYLGVPFESYIATFLSFALLFGLGLGALFGRNALRTIEPVETLHWQWGWSSKVALYGLEAGIAAAFLISLIYPVVNPYIYGNEFFVFGATFLRVGLFSGIVLGLLWAAIFGILIGGLQARQVEGGSNVRAAVNNSLRNSALVGIGTQVSVSLTIATLAIAIIISIIQQRDNVWVTQPHVINTWILLGCAFVGMIATMQYGLRFWVRHHVVRLLLANSGALPLKLVPVLDYARDLILLRRVPGGYIFPHRLLREHFASQQDGIDMTSRSETGSHVSQQRPAYLINLARLRWLPILLALGVWLTAFDGLQWLKGTPISLSHTTAFYWLDDQALAIRNLINPYSLVRRAEEGRSYPLIGNVRFDWSGKYVAIERRRGNVIKEVGTGEIQVRETGLRFDTFSPDSNYVVMLDSGNDMFHIIEIDSGDTAYETQAENVVWAPDSVHAIASREDGFEIIDATDTDILREEDAAHKLSIDGAYVAAQTGDDDFEVIEVTTGETLLTETGTIDYWVSTNPYALKYHEHAEESRYVVLTSDGYAVSPPVGSDELYYYYDLQPTNTYLGASDIPNNFSGQQILLFEDNQLVVWDASGGGTTDVILDDVSGAISNNALLAPGITEFQVRDQYETENLVYLGPIGDINMSPGGRFVAMVNDVSPYYLELETQSRVDLPQSFSRARAIWSPDGTVLSLITRSDPRIILLWDAVNQEEVNRFEFENWPYAPVIFSPDSSVILLNLDEITLVYDLLAHEEIGRFHQLYDVKWSENGTWLAYDMEGMIFTCHRDALLDTKCPLMNK